VTALTETANPDRTKTQDDFH